MLPQRVGWQRSNIGAWTRARCTAEAEFLACRDGQECRATDRTIDVTSRLIEAAIDGSQALPTAGVHAYLLPSLPQGTRGPAAAAGRSCAGFASPPPSRSTTRWQRTHPAARSTDHDAKVHPGSRRPHPAGTTDPPPRSRETAGTVPDPRRARGPAPPPERPVAGESTELPALPRSECSQAPGHRPDSGVPTSPPTRSPRAACPTRNRCHRQPKMHCTDPARRRSFNSWGCWKPSRQESRAAKKRSSGRPARRWCR